MVDKARLGGIKSYQDLVVWQLGMRLARETYLATKALPKEEMYGLASQMRRASVSVPANIAEGYGRGSRRDYISFLRISRGSLYELQTQVQLCEGLQVLSPNACASLLSLANECSRVLNGLITSLRNAENMKQ